MRHLSVSIQKRASTSRVKGEEKKKKKAGVCIIGCTHNLNSCTGTRVAKHAMLTVSMKENEKRKRD